MAFIVSVNTFNMCCHCSDDKQGQVCGPGRSSRGPGPYPGGTEGSEHVQLFKGEVLHGVYDHVKCFVTHLSQVFGKGVVYGEDGRRGVSLVSEFLRVRCVQCVHLRSS